MSLMHECQLVGKEAVLTTSQPAPKSLKLATITFSGAVIPIEMKAKYVLFWDDNITNDFRFFQSSQYYEELSMAHCS